MSDYFIQDDTVTAWADHARRISGTTETLNAAEIAEIFSRVHGDIKTDGEYLIEANGFGTDVIKSGTYDTGEIFAFPEPPENILTLASGKWVEIAKFDGWTATEPINSHFMTVGNNDAIVAALATPIDDMLAIRLNITQANTTISFHLNLNGATIYWGDGTSETLGSSYPYTHVYANAGTYFVKIPEFQNGSSMTNYTSIAGDSYASSGTNATNTAVTAIYIPKWVGLVKGMVYGLSNLETLQLADGVCFTDNESYYNDSWKFFYGCTSLRYLTLPQTTYYQINDFGKCTSLEWCVVPYGITEVPYFTMCSSLTSFTIPSSVTTIGSNRFVGCSSLEHIYGAENVVSIGDYAFSESAGTYQGEFNDSLTTLVFPSVTSIGRNAFHGLRALTTLVLSANSVCSLSSASGLFYNIIPYIYVPDNLVDSYKSNDSWYQYRNCIKPLSEYTGEV